MPHVINGIGTWYYGKRNVHRLRGVCDNCSAAADLESYDTTLYFTVFFVPVIPLARKRILESCPSCQRHKVIPLANATYHEGQTRQAAPAVWADDPLTIFCPLAPIKGRFFLSAMSQPVDRRCL